jgi:hypothetical protein
MTGSPEAHDLYEAVDDLCLLNLSIWGIPEAIAEWDGWRVPTSEDLDRLQHILMAEKHKGIYCKDHSLDWLLVGEDPHFEQLQRQCRPLDPHVHHSPSPVVPGPSALPKPSEDVHMADVVEGLSQ